MTTRNTDSISNYLILIVNTDNYHYICEADVTPPSVGHAVHFDYENTGLTCGDDNTDWHETVSESGRAVVICLITPPAPPRS